MENSQVMSTFDLIAFDMDGTLLSTDKKILPSSIEAIHAAVEAGKIVALSTGRCVPEIDLYRDELKEVRYVICLSGALIYDNLTKEVIHSCVIPKETVFSILSQTKDLDLMVHILSDLSIVQADQERRMKDFKMGVYQEMFDLLSTRTDDIAQYYDANEPNVYKLNLYLTNQNDRDLLKSRFSTLPVTLADGEITALECSPLHVSKGSGLIRLCEYIGIPVSAAIAVGDSHNDLDILRTAGLSIAMGNSKKHVREIADVLVDDNDHSGCAQAIYQYLLS